MLKYKHRIKTEKMCLEHKYQHKLKSKDVESVMTSDLLNTAISIAM